MKIVDRRGARYGRWLVLELDPKKAGRVSRWLCRCDCGTERAVSLESLTKGVSRSCGCLKTEVARLQGTLNATHGHSHSPTWVCWSSMMQRCTNPNSNTYPDYGGKGIEVCERWKSFANFLADMGERPSKDHSVDRIDNSKGYELRNCRWATTSQQARNRSTNRLATLDGVTLCVAEWSERLGIKARDVHRMTFRGATPEDAILRLANRLHEDVPYIVRRINELSRGE